MAEPQQKLADGIQKVSALHGATISNETLIDEAWAAVKTGIVVARKFEEALDAHTEEEMHQVLEFLVQRWAKKRASRGQVNECVRIVLARPRWLSEARRDEDLRASLREVLSGNPEMLEKLDGSGPGVLGTDGEPEGALCPALQRMEGPKKHLNIKQQLLNGCKVMKKFEWEFPHDPLGTKLDEATGGFQSFFEGVTALTTTSGKASVDGDIDAVLAEFEDHWSGILRFLLSMHGSGVRITYTARIKFVVVNLRSFSLTFRQLTPWASLPWGHEPMPAEEALEEAKSQEEKARRREEAKQQCEANDHRLACELQAQEEARHRAEEEDARLARELQAKLNAGVVC